MSWKIFADMDTEVVIETQAKDLLEHEETIKHSFVEEHAEE